LADLDDLRWLELGANNLGDVAPILHLPQLISLSVHDNYLDPSEPALVAALEVIRSRGGTVVTTPQRTLGFWATPEDGPARGR
jgi:hypothetical protein